MDLMKSVCNELYNVFGSDLMGSEAQLFDYVVSVAVATAENNSSMQQDIQHGRKTGGCLFSLICLNDSLHRSRRTEPT